MELKAPPGRKPIIDETWISAQSESESGVWASVAEDYDKDDDETSIRVFKQIVMDNQEGGYVLVSWLWKRDQENHWKEDHSKVVIFEPDRQEYGVEVTLSVQKNRFVGEHKEFHARTDSTKEAMYMVVNNEIDIRELRR